jgi:cytochrome c-type biogenesis protein CcmF
MHYLIGNIGHLSVIVAFVAAVVAAFGYFKAGNSCGDDKNSWLRFAKITFAIHSLSVFTVIGSLFFIIYNHYFEYHYAWSHSSLNLPTHYMISCFWEGQEGSFLLWIFWHVLLGWIVIERHSKWSAQVMTVFALVQAFLTSMILGVVLPSIDLKIGSSPFILLRDAMASAPVFKINPEYIPEDGKGLNPLLQNYWMVIHPPTLFLGFAATLVPFSFAIAGLWNKDVKDWIKPALPWALFAVAVLGVGIMMGAYWAYETLNFGGYWNWDPVENAVYIPWLVLVAAVHSMSLSASKQKAYMTSAILVMTSFILVLYATFLTRSGILGNASVHSFTDLGLSGQLLIYLLSFTALAIALLVARRKLFPTQPDENNVLAPSFWVFGGIILLLLTSFQVFASTSIPVFNALIEAFGIKSNLAPPADPIAHYSTWQLVFAACIAVVSAIGQFMWWNKTGEKKGWKAIQLSLFATLILSSAAILLIPIHDFTYILLFTTSLFSILANGEILWYIIKKQPKLSGGSLAHFGLGVMLIGILFSAGYSEVLSINKSGLIYRKDFSEELNRDNVLLWRNTPLNMGNYTLKFKGVKIEVEGMPVYVAKKALAPTDENPYRAVALQDLTAGEKTYFKKGDTVGISPENTYYEINFKDNQERQFTLYPRAQVNPNMGLIASPDLKHTLLYDLYVHVSSIPSPDEEKKWSEAESHVLVPGDTFFVNDMIAIFEGLQKPDFTQFPELEGADAAIQAKIKILDKEDTHLATPLFVIRGNMVGRIPSEIDGLGIKIALQHIDPVKQQFVFESQTTQKDWVILKVAKKPMINLLWLGSIMMTVGFVVAGRRRWQELKAALNKPQHNKYKSVNTVEVD